MSSDGPDAGDRPAKRRRAFGLDGPVGPVDETGRRKPRITKPKPSRPKPQPRPEHLETVGPPAPPEPAKPPARRKRGEYVPARATDDERRQAAMDRVLVAFSAGASSHREAASAARIDRQTLADWVRRGDMGEEPYATFLLDLCEAMQQAKTRYIERIEAGASTDWKAAAKLLDRLDARDVDPVDAAYGEMTREEAIEAFAQHPEVVKRVLARGEAGRT